MSLMKVQVTLSWIEDNYLVFIIFSLLLFIALGEIQKVLFRQPARLSTVVTRTVLLVCIIIPN